MAPTMYSYEADLVADLSVRMQTLLPASDHLFEVPTYAGVPDLVLAQWDEMEKTRRESLGYVTDFLQLAIWISVSERTLTTRDLHVLTHASERHIRSRLLPALENRGLVESTPSGWRALRPYRCPADSLVTFEAKLVDWRKGLGQAARHVASADNAWLALPACSAATAFNHASDFRLNGVGLVALSPEGRLDTLIQPAKGARKPLFRAFLAEQAGFRAQEQTTEGWKPPKQQVFGRHLPTATERRARLVGGAAR